MSYKDRCQMLISFERVKYERIRELLPNGVTIHDELNAMLKDRMFELECERSRVR